MPNAKDNQKMSGDIRPPVDPAPFAPEELKEANLGADGTPRDRGQAGSRKDKDEQESQPGGARESGAYDRKGR